MRKIIILLVGFMYIGMANGSDEVKFDASGQWVYDTGMIPSLWQDKAIWIDVLVKDLAFDKKVGVRWTDDNWNTHQDSLLTFEQAYQNGYERWGLDFAPLGRLTSYYIGSWYNYVTQQYRSGGTHTRIEFAVFYEVNGQTYWDNNHSENYTLDLSLF